MLLRTKDITKRFGKFTALDLVDFEVSENEVRSIIGPNGAGKTTLFNILTGIYEPTKGTVIFDGKDISQEPVHERTRLGISRSHQITNVYDEMTVHENVETAVGCFHHNYYNMIAPTSSIEGLEPAVTDLLEEFNLLRQKNVKAHSLSHGDKRYLELAMALASDPKLLLLDEPTAGMSTNETKKTLDMIRGLAEDRSIVLVEHNIEGVMTISDRITVLEQGEIIAEGTPDEMRQSERVKEAYLGGGRRA